MQLIHIQGFSESTNAVISESLLLANKLNSKDLNTNHIMIRLLYNNELKERFNERTGIDYTTFCSEAMRVLESEEFKSEDSFSELNLTFNDISVSTQYILQNLFKKFGNHRLIQPSDLLEEILLDDTCEVYDILRGMGMKELRNKNETLMDRMPITAKFAIDMTKAAKENCFDPIESRDDIIEQMIQVLGRRAKANVCLIGEPGVGKTSIVEGLAQRIVENRVPKNLQEYHIIDLDMSALVGGTRYRGDFEERFNSILYEIAKEKNIIIFIDEFHTIMDSGSLSESSTTAANMLKPAIAKGGIKIIGATTTKEYKKSIEKDSAFERRIQPIMVNEPSIDEAIKMTKKVMPEYVKFHNVDIPDETIEAAVKLSDRYITNRQLPDKAISILDDTAARVKSTALEDKIVITYEDIKETISKNSGIDIRELDLEERDKLKNLEKKFSEEVIGQDSAVKEVAKAIKRAKAGIKDPSKPIGTFLFVGPTGVGKTELAKTVAKYFSTNKDLIRFDMSEYMEEYSVSKLIGSAPGYVAHKEGGQLTEAVKHNPYSVILFDEIEKAHRNVYNIFLQILDEGCLTDSQGVKVDFKNTVIIFTSNAGYGYDVSKPSIGFANNTEVDKDTHDKMEKVALKELENTFRPEFLNRLDKVVLFDKLSKDTCKNIVKLLLNKVATRLKENNITITCTDTLINKLLEHGFSEKYGARNLKRSIQSIVEDELADKIINEEICSGDTVSISYKENTGIVIKKKKQLNLGTEIEVESMNNIPVHS